VSFNAKKKEIQKKEGERQKEEDETDGRVNGDNRDTVSQCMQEIQ